ncbi:MAG: class I mannose-6-phosphate isomerase [Defluviitaleaceae bacterium]|nr:class I mannose-6-phosphate isomerase [Defluviitaleaceae bacterium]
MEMYPLLFVPIVKEMIWGRESWDVTCRPNEMSVIENGVYAGMAFDAYMDMDRVGTLGTRLADTTRFPLLVKIITAVDTLSVQVHPDDDYARRQSEADSHMRDSHVRDSGKSEMWYILEPPAEGNLIIGLKDGVDKKRFDNIIKTESISEHLNYLSVKAGDMVNIPAGLLHALTPGTTLAEIQQNSDTTYRIYDYGRLGADGKPRELHINHAMNVIDFGGRIPKEVTGSVTCPHFSVSKYILEGTRSLTSDPEAFDILINVSGKGSETPLTLRYSGGETVLPPRRSVFIPAGLGEYDLLANHPGALLKCSVPR